MDKLSRQIVKILQEDARTTTTQMAVMLGEDEATVKKAVRALESSGVIVKYAAIVDEEKAENDMVQALIEVRVTPQKMHGFDAIAEEIYSFEEVKSLYLMSGGYDLAVFVEGKNLLDIAKFVAERLSGLDNVLSTATHFILKKYKVEGTVTRKTPSRRLAVQA